MTPEPRDETHTHNRLTELVVELCGVGPARARTAIDEALARNGDTGDQLLNIADAIITLRGDPAEATTFS